LYWRNVNIVAKNVKLLELEFEKMMLPPRGVKQ